MANAAEDVFQKCLYGDCVWPGFPGRFGLPGGRGYLWARPPPERRPQSAAASSATARS
jgi:hypothetical protein